MGGYALIEILGVAVEYINNIPVIILERIIENQVIPIPLLEHTELLVKAAERIWG